MNQQLQEERTIASLRIDVQSDPDDDRPALFTMVDDGGSALSAGVSFKPGKLENLHDVLAGIAAQTIPAAGGLPFGEPDGTRVILGFDGDAVPPYRFYVTFAFPSGGEGYQPVTGRAPVSAASLARFVDGLRAVQAAGQGTVDWTLAD